MRWTALGVKGLWASKKNKKLVLNLRNNSETRKSSSEWPPFRMNPGHEREKFIPGEKAESLFFIYAYF